MPGMQECQLRFFLSSNRISLDTLRRCGDFQNRSIRYYIFTLPKRWGLTPLRDHARTQLARNTECKDGGEKIISNECYFTRGSGVYFETAYLSQRHTWALLTF
jgi:hypothetical protein